MNILIDHTALVDAEVLPGCMTKGLGGLLARDPWLRLGGCHAALVAGEVLPVTLADSRISVFQFFAMNILISTAQLITEVLKGRKAKPVIGDLLARGPATALQAALAANVPSPIIIAPILPGPLHAIRTIARHS